MRANVKHFSLFWKNQGNERNLCRHWRRRSKTSRLRYARGVDASEGNLLAGVRLEEAPLFSDILPRMRLPRFNLRIALVVTAIAAVVAWQASIVYQRKAAMQAMQPVTFVLAVR